MVGCEAFLTLGEGYNDPVNGMLRSPAARAG